MDDGLMLPGLPDGMATFAGPQGLTILIRNHELTPKAVDRGPFGPKHERLEAIDPGKIYDRGHGRTPSCGGTTTVVYDTARQRVVRQFLSLAGTSRNCAGGPTPWNTWVTCEETVDRAGVQAGKKDDDGYENEKDHGYNFEVPACSEISLADPIPLKAMGRFKHEAIAVDPRTSIVYQTEDQSDGLIYRFLPNRPEHLAAGGRLQALAFMDRKSADTRNWEDPATVQIGESHAVRWLDCDEVESPQDDLRNRLFAAGAARFARGEGMWYGNNEIYFAATSGGPKKIGQIWKYISSPHEGQNSEGQSPGKLELFVEPTDSQLVHNADNLTVAPWGDLIVCEDRSDAEVKMVGVTPDGHIYTLGHNSMRCEFAGATFSRDGSTLFVNLQQPGLTLAITGPWPVA